MKNPTYNDLLQAAEWQTRRQQILERDGHRCLICDAAEKLQVHHRQYHYDSTTGEKTAPWLYAGKYLITLCDDCHSFGHHHFKVPSFNINPNRL